MLVIGNAFSVSMLKETSFVYFKQIDLNEVKEIINLEPEKVKSIIGHDGTAKLFSQLLEIDLPKNKEFYQSQPGDLLIVGNINQRLPDGKILSYEETKELEITWWVIVILKRGRIRWW